MTPEQQRYERASELFNQAVDMELSQRKTFLAAACAGDPLLLEAAENLLSNHEKEEQHSLVEEFSLGEELLEPFGHEPPDPMLGRRVGRYEIRRRIGAGGMGVVYLAVQRDDLKRRVAIKFIKPGTDSQAILQRFYNERQILASLHHRHIATVLDGGTSEDGRPYFVMEYIEGKPIDEYCDEKKLSTRKRLELFMGVCAAVHCAHQHGVIHRDLSPDNIRVTEDGEPKLLDFGIAKLINPDLGFATDDGTTRPEYRFMKPEYASPERVRGDPVTTESDIYSLGVVLYRLLTGHPPYRFRRQTWDDIQRTVCEAEPEKPSVIVRSQVKLPRADGTTTAVTPEEVSRVRDGRPAKLRRNLAGEVDKIVLMALRKERDRRFKSAEHFREDIERQLKGLPLRWAVKDTVIYHLRKFIQRHLGLVVAAGLILLSLLGGITGTTAALFRAWDAEAVANRKTEDAIKAQEKTQRELAGRLLHTAFVQCGKGEVGPGLLSLVEALDAATRGKDADLEHVIRVNLAAWHPHLASVPPPSRHPQGTEAVAFSPDGRRALTGGADGTVLLWNLADGTEVIRMTDRRGAVHAVAFSPDGRRALTGGADGTVLLWNLADGRLLGELIGHRSAVHAVAFSPDGCLALTGGADCTARLWDLATRSERRALKHNGLVRAVAFRPSDGQLILTGSDDNTARLWNPATGVSQPLGHSGPVRAVAFSPSDGKTFVTAGVFPPARLWQLSETAEPKEIRQFPHRAVVGAVAFRPDGKVLLMGSNDGLARFWDCQDGKPLGRPLPHRGAVKAVAFHPSEKVALTGDGDGAARRWKTEPDQFPLRSLPQPGVVYALAYHPRGEAVLTGVSVATRTGCLCLSDLVRGEQSQLPASPHHGAVWAVAFSRDGKLILSGSQDGKLRLWEATTGKELRNWEAHKGVVKAVAFDPSGQVVLSGSSDGTAALWWVADGKPIHRLPHDAGKIVGTVAFSPDGQTVLSASEDGTARLWDVNTGHERDRLNHGEGVGVRAAVFRPDGKAVLTGDTDGKVRLWHPDTRAVVELNSHSRWVTAVAFSPDGKTTLSGSTDGTAQLWDTEQGKPVGHRLQHGGDVTAVAFSLDGRIALTGTGGADHAGYFWDAATGLPLGPPLPHSGHVSALAFSRDGTVAVTGSHDRTARLWKVPVARTGDWERIRLWVQVATGMESDKNGEPRELTSESWRQRRRLEELQAWPDR
jgi:WD40 repeat protein/serine/threonine protein kinase